MNPTLADLANLAAIVSVPLMLFTWLVTRERFAAFWKKRFKPILIIMVFAGLIGLWRIGWLNWVQYQVILPIWVLLLYPMLIFGLIVSLGLLAFYIYDRRNPIQDQSQNYYTIYGARWYLNSLGGPSRPPVCDKDLIEMRNESMPIVTRPIEAWRCRQCGREVRWNEDEKGDLLEDVRAHYNAELRRAAEQKLRR